MGNNQGTNIQKEDQLKGKSGYQVIEITADSPGSQSNLQIFIDFIVEIIPDEIENLHTDIQNQQNTETFSEKLTFFDQIESLENQNVTLLVYNLRTDDYRKVSIVPNRNWKHSNSLLGIVLRKENYLLYRQKTFKICEIIPNSPAYDSGLTTNEEFILGILEQKYEDIYDLAKIIQQQEKNGINLAIYNIKQEKIRLVWIKPERKYQGDQKYRISIGCVFKSGSLNEFPLIDTKNSQNLDPNFAFLNDQKLNLNNNSPIMYETYYENQKQTQIITCKDNNKLKSDYSYYSNNNSNSSIPIENFLNMSNLDNSQEQIPTGNISINSQDINNSIHNENNLRQTPIVQNNFNKLQCNSSLQQNNNNIKEYSFNGINRYNFQLFNQNSQQNLNIDIDSSSKQNLSLDLGVLDNISKIGKQSVIRSKNHSFQNNISSMKKKFSTNSNNNNQNSQIQNELEDTIQIINNNLKSEIELVNNNSYGDASTENIRETEKQIIQQNYQINQKLLFDLEVPLKFPKTFIKN